MKKISKCRPVKEHLIVHLIRYNYQHASVMWFRRSRVPHPRDTWVQRFFPQNSANFHATITNWLQPREIGVHTNCDNQCGYA